MLAGLSLGLAAFFLKLAMSGDIYMLIYSWNAWIAAIFSVTGFLLMQLALRGYVTVAIPTITGVSILISIVLSCAFLGETIHYLKWAGILLVLAGVFGLSLKISNL